MPNFHPDSSSLASEASAQTKSVATFVGDAARGAVESVAHDGATVLTKDASLGARLEAGANLAADAGAFVAGPEEVGAERAAAFAIKQGIEHAPQIRGLGEALAKEALAATPEVAATVDAAFSRTKALLAEAGHKIVQSQPDKGIIETKNATYYVIEKGAARDSHRLHTSVNDAHKNSKNFAIHAPELADTEIDAIERLNLPGNAAKLGVKATLATSEDAIAKSIGEMERGNGIVARLQHHRISVTDVWKTVAALNAVDGAYESVKRTVDAVEETPAGQAAEKEVKHLAADIRHDVATAVHAGENAAESAAKHVHSSLENAESTGSRALHAAEGVAHESRQQVASATQHVADETKQWSPGMAFDQFEKLLNHVRGGVSPQGHVPAASRAPAQGHGIGH